MSAQPNFEGRGLTRPDELLARVVVDLGLARQGDVLSAVDMVGRARAAGDGKTLAQALQDMGSLHPRFVTVVMKAVNNKLVAEGHAPVPLPEPKSPPAVPASLPAAPKSWPAMPAADPATAGGRTPAAPPPAPTPPAAEAPVSRPPVETSASPPAAPAPPAAKPPVARRPAPRTQPPPPAPAAPAKPPEEPPEGPRREGADVIIPEAALFRQAPRGQSFSRRSKSEVAAAWAARKEGGAPAHPGQKPPGRKEFTAEDRLARLGGPPQPPSAEPRLPGTAPANPLAALVSPREPGRDDQARPVPDPLLGSAGPASGAPPGHPGPVDPRVGLDRPPEDEPAGRPPARRGPSGLSALMSPKQRRGEPKGPPKQPYQRRKSSSTGATQSIDVDQLRAELGIESKAKDEPAGPQEPAAERQKAIELQAFVKRAVRSMLHQQCLDLVLRKRLMTIRASELAKEAACRDRDARRVLDDWKSAGIMLLDDMDMPDPQFQFSPAKADLSTIREFMVAWNDSEWHNRLLGWIIEEEHG